MAPRTKAKPQALQPVPTRRSQRNQPHQPLDGPDAAVLDVPAVTFEELRRRNNRKGAPNSQNAPTSLQPQDDHDLSTAAKVASEIQLHRQDIIPATASVNISSPMHRGETFEFNRTFSYQHSTNPGDFLPPEVHPEYTSRSRNHSEDAHVFSRESEGDYDATDEASDSSVISITHHNGYQHPRNNSQLEYPDEDEYQYTDDENQYTNENEQEQPDDDSDWFPSHNTRSPATGLISDQPTRRSERTPSPTKTCYPTTIRGIDCPPPRLRRAAPSGTQATPVAARHTFARPSQQQVPDYEDFEKDLQELDNQLSSDSDTQTPCAIRRKPPQCSTQTYDEENSLSYYNDSPIHPSIITPGRGAPRDAPRDTRRADPSAARNSHAARVGHSVAGTLRDYVRDEVLPRSTQASDVEFSPNEYDSSPVRPRAAPRGTRRADPSAARNSHAARVGHSVAGTLRDHVRGEVLPRPTQASDVEISSNEYNSPLIQPRATARHAAPKNVRRGATSAMRGGAPTAQGRPPATQVGAGATHVPVGRSGTTRARGGTSANKSRGGAPTAQGRPAHDGVAARRGNREAQPAPALQSAAVQNVPARAAPALQALMSGRNLSPSVRRIVGSRLAGEDPRKSADVHKFLVEYRREETGNLRRLCKWCVELKAAGHETPNFGDYSMKTSTGVIRDHFLANHPEAWIKECDSLNLTMKGKQADAAEKYREEHNMQLTKAPRQMFTGRLFQDYVMEYFVVRDHAHRDIDSPQFRNICLLLRETLQDRDIPHRTTLHDMILESWAFYMHKLKAELRTSLGNISCTSDGWTDPTVFPYLAVTAHWVQRVEVEGQAQETSGLTFRLKFRGDVIGFYGLPISHTGEHLAAAFLDILERIAIADKIGFVTLDNASNNKTMLEHLERMLGRKGIQFSAKKNGLSCFPHIVHLACSAVTEAANAIQLSRRYTDNPHVKATLPTQGIITRCRVMVRRIRISPTRKEEFGAIVEKRLGHRLQLLRDVDNRWAYTVAMMVRLVELKDDLLKFQATYGLQYPDVYVLEPAEWEAVNDMITVLRVGHAFQQRLSSDKTPTLCDALPSFTAMLSNWAKLKDKLPKLHNTNIIEAGMAKLEKYQKKLEDIPVYLLSMILNPKIKLSWLAKQNVNRSDGRNLVEEAKELFFTELERIPIPTTETARPASSTSHNDDAWISAALGEDDDTSQDVRADARQEGLSYLADIDHGVYPDSLTYWQNNIARWPRVFQLAMNILPAQGSSVPCERAFSSAKLTKSDLRNRMTSQIMEACQILKYGYKTHGPIDFTSHMKYQAELKELEDLAEKDDELPEGDAPMQDFQASFHRIPNIS